jgi:type 2 lantibiotic biosynthesis protein LanM
MLTGERYYTELAGLALVSARAQVARQKQYGCIGAFEGIGGWVYVLSHMGRLWREPALYQEAEEIVQSLPVTIERDELFDLLSGSAGCISSLLSLYAVAPSEETLAAALRCGEHLMEYARTMEHGIGWSTRHEQHPLTGLSHGNAGMALSLLRLFEVSGKDTFRQGALAAIEYERSVFSPDQQNWPDLRLISQPTDGKGRAYMVAWCHGAPGIGLARLASLHMLDDATIRAEIDVAVCTTLAHGFGRNHSLCHGDCGNIELVSLAARLLPGSFRYNEQLKRLLPMLLDSIDVQGWLSGIPTGVETPGLMTGLAGTGYALLRLAAPELVPSLLLLEPPRQGPIDCV